VLEGRHSVIRTGVPQARSGEICCAPASPRSRVADPNSEQRQPDAQIRKGRQSISRLPRISPFKM